MDISNKTNRKLNFKSPLQKLRFFCAQNRSSKFLGISRAVPVWLRIPNEKLSPFCKGCAFFVPKTAQASLVVLGTKKADRSSLSAFPSS